MKVNNYQYSFNHLSIQSQSNETSQTLLLLFRDIFPYMKLRSATLYLQLLTILPFLIRLGNSTLFPSDQTASENAFIVVLVYLLKSMVFLRLSSQYQHRLGFKYMAAIFASALLLHLIGFLLLGISLRTLPEAFTDSLLSIYILSIIDLNKFKENQPTEFEQEEKVVQNYDLLDLNDTIIKLKAKDNSFTYESYTNKEFYQQNANSNSTKTKSTSRKIVNRSKKSNNLSRIIDESYSPSDYETIDIKIYKIIVFHFIVFAHTNFTYFFLFLVVEAMIYLFFSTKVIKKCFE